MLTKTTKSDRAKEALIAKALKTKKGREALAAAMIEPIRCGGMTYIEGIAHIWLGGVAYPYDAFKAAQAQNNGSWPTEWCKAYRANKYYAGRV